MSSNSDNFLASLLAFKYKTEEALNTTVRKITFAVFYNVVLGSPFDTGRFIGNWQVGLGVCPEGTLDIFQTDKMAQADAGKAILSKAQAGGLIYIANNLPYAVALEYGHSSQAPSGMVRITLANINAITSGAIE